MPDLVSKIVQIMTESSSVSKGVNLIKPNAVFIAACQQAAWSRTKWSPTAYLEAAVALLSFVLGKGCGQLRRLWSRSTGGKSVEKAVSGDVFVLICFMNPPESILIRKMKSDRRRFSLVCRTMEKKKLKKKKKKKSAVQFFSYYADI